MNNMAQMNSMAGVPAGGPVSMMPAGAGPMMMGNSQNGQGHRSILNTCIYEYLIKEGMYDSARALLNAPDSEVKTRAANEPNANGVSDDAMDTDSKDDVDSKRPADLPLPSNVATNFLYEWFTLFWDMQAAATRRTQVQNPAVGQYFQHTQQQNRLRQNQQQELLRSMRPDGMFNPQNPMIRQMPNGMQIGQNKNNLARTAMANNTNPQAMQMLQKQGQMQQNAADMDANRRPGSPGAAENAPSPNKRPRLDGNGAPFNGQQPGMMPNGQRPQGAMPGQQVQPGQQTNNAAQAQQLLLTNGINPNNLTPQQFQQFQNQPPHAQVKSIQAYSQNLQQHHGQQMPNKQAPNPNAPQGQGSPGMMPGQGPDGANLNAYYHPGEMGNPGAMRPGAPGQVGGAGGSNHALQDYQMQLMLLEQQNKKRLMMARQEQDSMGNMPRADGQPGPAGAQGANGQPFQDTSPQAARSGASPNPSEQMKRGTPQMGAAGIPSPLPEGANSRGSPNPMNFMQGNMDPNMNPQFFKMGNGMEHNGMGNVQMNGGMRPPSSHPGQPGFQGQMTPQMAAAAAAARQQGAQGGPGGMQWQGQQPNGNGMPQQGQQGPPQGTPQQRAMPPPPSAPTNGVAANANASGRTTASPQQGNAAPPTPQQSNKAAPKKKDTKNAKTKAAAAKKNANTGATPASESQDQEPPTPATPITPAANANFPKGVQQPPASTAASSGAPAAPVAAPQPDQVGSFDPGMEFPINMDFANPTITTDVLQDFDFDSFLHDDADGANFGFDPSAFGMEGASEIGAD